MFLSLFLFASGISLILDTKTPKSVSLSVSELKLNTTQNYTLLQSLFDVNDVYVTGPDTVLLKLH